MAAEANATTRSHRRLLTVRARSALLAAGVVAVALALGGAVLLFVYRGQLQDNLDQTLRQQTQDRARLLDQGTEPTGLATTFREESMVWIGRVDGTVEAMGGSLTPEENPVPSNLDGIGTVDLLVREQKPGESEIETERAELRMSASTTPDGQLVVLAAAETEEIDKAVRQLRNLFLAAIPVIVLIVGGLAWLTTGRALRPVDRIRRRTEEVSGTNLTERVPVPEGRDEVHDLAVTMNDMLGRLESHDRAMRQFTADASHELRSPIANLRALVDTADIDDPCWQDLRTKLDGEADRLRDLVDNLLYLARRSEASTVGSADHGTVDLDELLFAEAELLAATDRVRLDLSGVSPVAVVGSAGDLQRLVRNLVDNASRHADRTVSLACREEGAGRDRVVILEVGDDGPGIPPADRGRAFERFARLDQARSRDAGGAGLGLSIVEGIAADHGASVEITESPAGGALLRTTFQLGV